MTVVRAGEVRRAVAEWLLPLAATVSAVVGAFALLAAQLLGLALFPVAGARARAVATRRTWLPAGLGAVNAVGYVVVAAVAARLGPAGALVGAVATVALFGALVLGLSGRAQAIGARLLGPERRDSALAATSLGWAVMAGVGLLPVVGWTLMAWWLVQALGTSALVLMGALAAAGAGAGGGGGVGGGVGPAPHAAR
jgi:hypothetical protein